MAHSVQEVKLNYNHRQSLANFLGQYTWSCTTVCTMYLCVNLIQF